MQGFKLERGRYSQQAPAANTFCAKACTYLHEDSCSELVVQLSQAACAPGYSSKTDRLIEFQHAGKAEVAVVAKRQIYKGCKNVG